MRRNVQVWLELVPSARWPYVSTGRVLRKAPRTADPALFVKVTLDVPDDLFRPRAEAVVVLPDREPIDAEGTWT